MTLIRGICFSKLRIGDKVKILSINKAPIRYRQRFLSVGIMPGVEFTLDKIAPFGDSAVIKFGNCKVCVRQTEGNLLDLEKLG